MKLSVKHTTKYLYDAPVSYGLQQVRLTPVSSRHQTVTRWDVEVVGGTRELSFTDQHGNETLLVKANRDTTEVCVTVAGEVETHTSDGIYGPIYGACPLWHFLQSTPRTEAGKGIKALSRATQKKSNTLSALHDLSKAVLKAVPYSTTSTFAHTSAEEALQAGGGVCQDHAQIFISAARLAGIPARYVSGYLMMDERVEQEASHAWAEAHVEGLGWVGFDVSNIISPDDRYIRIASGRDSREASPIKGMRIGAANESLIVSLQIQQ